MQQLLVYKIHFFKFLSMSDKPRLHELKTITSTRSTVQACLTIWIFPSVRENTIKEWEIPLYWEKMQSFTNLSSTLKYLIP